MTETKTSEALLNALRNAAAHKPTAEELNRQRVSYIMGFLDSKSAVTRAEVEAVLAEHEGRKAS
jgi:hypothetical protein